MDLFEHARGWLAVVTALCAAGLVPIGCGGSTVPGAPGGSGGSAGQGGSGGVAGWAACDGPGQCLALTTGCCAPCGKPTLADVTGVHEARQAEFHADTCTDPHPICPECATANEPNLVAFCGSGRCTALDIRQSELSACSRNSDCVLREPNCCVSCQPSAFNLIAIAKTHAPDYRSEVCEPEQACPACAPIYPPGYVAECGANHHCVVEYRENVCPAQLPPFGAACSNEDLACEYGSDLRPSCRTRALCINDRWHVMVAGCEPLPGPGQSGCPNQFPTSGTCSFEGLVCDLGSGAVCACGTCVGGLCGVTPHWGCVPAPSTPGCPPVAPALGSACTAEGLSCTYGLCGTSTSVGRRCTGGAWQNLLVACPA